ncbi:SLBB domain-containing protein [Opitutales bacterium]|nr:SLBB domain-containing protein [Opitutales bacterium]
MKFLFLITLTFFICGGILTLYSQGLSPQAQAVLNRLPPEQRAMALQEANRLSGSAGTVQSSKGEPSADAVTSVGQVDSSDIEEAIEGSGENQILILSELETSVSGDLNLEKENLKTAKSELSISEFLLIEKGLNDRIFDLQKLLTEIKSAKLDFLRDKISTIKEKPEEELKPFGFSFFNASIQTSMDRGMTSIPSNYKIGPGDYFEVQLFGQENAGYSIMIGRNGMIQFPGIGPINVFEKGGSFQDLKNLIKERVREQLGEGVQVSVSMGEVRLIKVFLAGEFNNPGIRLLSATSTIMEALLLSGGLTEYGSLRNVTLKRKGSTDVVYDFYSLLLQGENPAVDSLLEGDVIFMPRVKNRVSIGGQVARPAIYELSDATKLKDIIELAGGFSSSAYPSDIQLVRVDPFGNKLLKSLSFDSDANLAVLDGDSITIGSSTDLKKNSIKLQGEVDRAGEYEWKAGIKLLDVVKNKSILSDDADLNYALIRRLDPEGQVQILSFSPMELFKEDTKEQNIALQPKDLILFLPKFDIEARERLIRPFLKELEFNAEASVGTLVVSISGEVHFPGKYPMNSGMTVGDLIVAAGGLKDSAFSLAAEISRIGVDFINKADVEALVEHRLLESLLTEDSLNEQLQPGDVLSVKKIPSWQDGRIITLTGEVKFPGEYAIRKNEKIGEVLERAGGLTMDSFARGAVFRRNSLVEREEAQKEKLVQQLESDIASLSLSATSGDSVQKANSVAASLLRRLKDSESVGRLVIDLDSQLAQSTSSQITLRSGDKLHIPIMPSEISVMGEVQFPTSHLFQSGFSVDQYINLSGGFTQNADEKRIFVVKSNGAVLTKKGNGWFSGNQGQKNIQTGDVIVVPINLQKGKWLETLTSSTQIVYQLAVTAAAVNSF